jgi:hypothetical protein
MRCDGKKEKKKQTQIDHNVYIRKKKGKIEKRIIISDFSTIRKSRILINK